MALCIVDRNAKYGDAELEDSWGNNRFTAEMQEKYIHEISIRLPDEIVWMPETSEIGIEADSMDEAEEIYSSLDWNWDEIVEAAYAATIAQIQ